MRHGITHAGGALLRKLASAWAGLWRRPPPSRRALVVEDNPATRLMLCLTLQRRGFQVEEASDGREAVSKALAWKPNLAVVDIGLPGLDGYEVARQVRAALGGSIRLVAFTAYGQPEDRQRAFEAGFDAHLAKPADPDEFFHQLKLE